MMTFTPASLLFFLTYTGIMAGASMSGECPWGRGCLATWCPYKVLRGSGMRGWWRTFPLCSLPSGGAERPQPGHSSGHDRCCCPAFFIYILLSSSPASRVTGAWAPGQSGVQGRCHTWFTK